MNFKINFLNKLFQGKPVSEEDIFGPEDNLYSGELEINGSVNHLESQTQRMYATLVLVNRNIYLDGLLYSLQRRSLVSINQTKPQEHIKSCY